MDDIKSVIQIFLLLFAFAFVLVLAYAASRYVGSKAMKTMKGKYINLIESINMGTDKRIHLLKVGEEYILIASSGKNIEFLTKVDIHPLEGKEEENVINNLDFKGILQNYVKKFTNIKKQNKSESIDNKDLSLEEQNTGLSENILNENINKLRDISKKFDSHHDVGGKGR